MSTEDGLESKDYYIKHKDEEGYLGIHSIGYYGEYTQTTPALPGSGGEDRVVHKKGWCPMESWINVYDKDRKFLYSASRLYGDIDETLEEFESEGWEVVVWEPRSGAI